MLLVTLDIADTNASIISRGPYCTIVYLVQEHLCLHQWSMRFENIIVIKDNQDLSFLSSILHAIRIAFPKRHHPDHIPSLLISHSLISRPRLKPTPQHLNLPPLKQRLISPMSRNDKTDHISLLSGFGTGDISRCIYHAFFLKDSFLVFWVDDEALEKTQV